MKGIAPGEFNMLKHHLPLGLYMVFFILWLVQMIHREAQLESENRCSFSYQN